MMHQPSAGIGGTTADIEIQAENLEFTKQAIERITAEHTGQTEETISRDGDRDRWFTAEQAREYGMVDRVVESLDDVRPAASRRRMGLVTWATYTIPNVVERTPQGERAYDVFSRLLSERIIFLGTEIDDGVANVVIAQLLHLESSAPESEIAIYINSPGGSFTSLMAIYDTMTFVRRADLDVLRRAGGLDRGGAAGRRGSRAAVRAGARAGAAGPAGERRRARARSPTSASRPRRWSASAPQVEEVLARHTHHDVATLRADMDRDKVFTAQEAVAYGLADEVLSRRLVAV